MSVIPDYTDRLIALDSGPAGELVELDTRVFNDDMEAHDPELQERYWLAMSANFQTAVEQATAQWGTPENRINDDHDEADTWLERVQFGFIELATWVRDDGQHIFVLLDHEDRELPILLMAGVTE